MLQVYIHEANPNPPLLPHSPSCAAPSLGTLSLYIPSLSSPCRCRRWQVAAFAAGRRGDKRSARDPAAASVYTQDPAATAGIRRPQTWSSGSNRGAIGSGLRGRWRAVAVGGQRRAGGRVCGRRRRRRHRWARRAVMGSPSPSFFIFYSINRGGYGATASENSLLTETIAQRRLTLTASEKNTVVVIKKSSCIKTRHNAVVFFS